LIASDLEKLLKALNALEKIAQNFTHELDDMHLLGIGLNQEILKDLNQESIKYFDPVTERNVQVFFDGLAAGQYLFGCNMVHSEGFIKSGYEQVNSPVRFLEVEWEKPKWCRNPELVLNFKYGDAEYTVANLHIHSKLKIETSLSSNIFWEIVIEKANLGQVTVYRKPSFFYKNRELTIRFLLKVKSKLNVGF
jgi:hypothetical protein